LAPECDNGQRYVVVMGLPNTGGNPDAAEAQRRALNAVGTQLVDLVQPGFPGADVVIFSLSRPFAQAPTRVRFACVPPAPRSDPTPCRVFTCGDKAAKEQARQRQYDELLQTRRNEVKRFAEEKLVNLTMPPGPADPWSLLAAATREFAQVESGRRFVLIGGDEQVAVSGPCPGCINLAGARCIFFDFDLPNAGTQLERESSWRRWLSPEGDPGDRRALRFFRSGDVVEHLFDD
jgi:hypothetical protein